MQENGKPSQASNQIYKGESPGRQFIVTVVLCRFAHQLSRNNLICWDLYQPRIFEMKIDHRVFRWTLFQDEISFEIVIHDKPDFPPQNEQTPFNLWRSGKQTRGLAPLGSCLPTWTGLSHPILSHLLHPNPSCPSPQYPIHSHFLSLLQV